MPFEPTKDADRLLAAVVEWSDDAILAKDLDGRILTWNRAAERMYGYTASEMLGRPVTTIVPGELHPEIAAILARIKADDPIDHYETVRLTKDGTRLHVSLTVSPVKDQGGRVVAASVIAHDITPRLLASASLKTSEARWRAIFESAIDGIIVIDHHGLIDALNPAAERLFGYTEQELSGRNVSILMPAPYRDEHDDYLDAYLKTGVKKIIGIGRQVVGRRRDGRTFPLHLSVGEFNVDGNQKFTGIVHDLSARVEAEERLREQASLAKLGEMAAVIAHEVKNPLAAVSGAIQVIGGRLPAGSKDQRIVTEILARLEALNNLINDLLLFARPRQLRLAPTEIVSLLQLTADLLARDPTFAGVSVEIVGTAAPVMGDAELLKIVFQNLMINAAHAVASQGNGVIRMAVTTAEGSVRVAIADNGPGIPPEVRGRLFEPFFTTKARGTGLGLATAKRLVDAHLGTIALDCPVGGGTTVMVQLPAQGG